jgi:hypothetical protein
MRKLTARPLFLFCLFFGALRLTAQEQGYSKEALESPELYARLYDTGRAMLGTNLMQHSGITSSVNWVDYSGYKHWTCTIETSTGSYMVITDGNGFINRVEWKIYMNKNNADEAKIKDAVYRGVLVRGKEVDTVSGKAYYISPVMLYVSSSNRPGAEQIHFLIVYGRP